MPFEQRPGLPGKVYVPARDSKCGRKHPCRDCFACQNCSNERCGLCLRSAPKCAAKTLGDKSGLETGHLKFLSD